MATPPPVTDTLARFVAETDYLSISERALANTKMHILDTLGVALAAVSTPVATIAFDYCTRTGGASEASVWGAHLNLPVPIAAFANGLLAHGLDYDDWDAYIHVGHPTSMLTAAALCLGEFAGASGKELLKGYVLPLEKFARIDDNVTYVQVVSFHRTTVFGSLGA